MYSFSSLFRHICTDISSLDTRHIASFKFLSHFPNLENLRLKTVAETQSLMVSKNNVQNHTLTGPGVWSRSPGFVSLLSLDSGHVLLLDRTSSLVAYTTVHLLLEEFRISTQVILGHNERSHVNS